MFDFDLDELKKEQKEAKNQKAWLGVIGEIGQNFADIPTAADMMLGRKTSPKNIRGLADSFSSFIEDPYEAKKSDLAMAKTQSELKKEKAEADRAVVQKDPMSKDSLAAKAFYSKIGLEVNPNDSAYDLTERYGKPGDLAKEKMKSQIEFGNQKQLLAMKQDFDRTENEKNRINEIQKLANKPGAEFDRLPLENQEQIRTISRKSGDIRTIKNMMQQSFNQLNDENIDDEQKVIIGRELLKTLNSPLGADAIGAEEAKRLGGLLEYKLFNFADPGSMFGRDLDMFTDQVNNNIKRLDGVLGANKENINSMYGRKSPSEMISSMPEDQRKALQQQAQMELIRRQREKELQNASR